jgi:alkylation response protein AidB-like acyl-CoA dehydrogenase
MSQLDIEDRKLLGQSVARWVAEEGGLAKRIKNADAPGHFDAKLWNGLSDLGLMTLLIPREQGGIGGGAAELVEVMRALGPALLKEPFVSTAIVAAPLWAELCEGGSDQLQSALEAGTPMALAFSERHLGFAVGPVTTEAKRTSTGWILRGQKAVVLDADATGLFLVTAKDDMGIGVYLAKREQWGLRISSAPSVDSRDIGVLTFDDVVATRLGTGDASSALARALDRGALAMCAEAVGIMSALVQATREHLVTRKQFGRALSEFQVLQHRLVDMYVHAEESAAVVESAAASFEESVTQREQWVSIAKIRCGESGRFVSQQSVQLHGALGMTNELSVGHYFKRLMMLDALFGDSRFHLERYRRSRYADPTSEGACS